MPDPSHKPIQLKVSVIVIEVTSAGLINSKVSALEQSLMSVVVKIYNPVSKLSLSSVFVPSSQIYA